MKVSDSQFSGFASAGTIIMHTAETGRTGTEYSSVVWKSPGEGHAVISGGVWLRQTFNRPQRWELQLNGTSQTIGDLAQGVGFTESNPYDFSLGTGGASATTLYVSPGDEIGLLLYRQSNVTPGDLIGLNLTVTFTAVPEPGRLLLMLTGLGVILLTRRFLTPIRPDPSLRSRPV